MNKIEQEVLDITVLKLTKYYEEGIHTSFIKYPILYALYKTWKEYNDGINSNEPT